MLTVTVEDVIGWDPCYLREADKGEPYLRKLYSARERWTASDVCRDMPPQGVPAMDVLWTVLREELIPAPMLHELACVFAERALMRERDAGREPDARSLEAIRVKRLWLAGQATDEELAAAWDAASAALDAARDATWDAARDAWGSALAARAAARAAARDAALAAWGSALAAWDAAWAATWDAARDAEAQWQLEQVIALLAKMREGA